ncbi:hypothetical protein N2E09_00295 [Leuconostoc citreum]
MYTVLDENLMVKGRLSLNNGQGSTSFFGDTITTQLATDNANDPTNLTTNDYTNQDKQGNAKQWSHSLTISFESTDLGTSITTNDYLMYFDDVVNHYYLMKVLGSDTDRSSGYITATAINAAIYELGKQLIQTEQTLSQVDLKTFVTKMYKNAPFSLQIADNNLTTVDYTISANTSLQALLQDLQTKFNVDVDSWVEVDNTGHITDRVLYFGNRGRDNGELIRYGGAKGFEAMTATEVSDIIYTKLYVTGKTDDKNTTKGHIGTVNNGLEYIVDDEANQKLYAIGASQQHPVYLEGAITNNLLSEPQALLDWAKEQMTIFNHPRFNYTVTPLHDQNVALGDIITVQDFHIKPMILVNSKVIQKTTSFASPETNTFVLGEFSSIFTDNMNKGANVITLIKKDVTVVQEAADYAKAQADAAHAQAVIAQEQAIHAQTTANGKLTGYTADSVEDLPAKPNNGDIAWVTLNDGTHGYTYLNGKWVEDLNPTLKKDITDGVNKATSDAKVYADQAIATNGANVSASIKTVDDKANQLKADQTTFDNKAQGYANQAKSDAEANTAAIQRQLQKAISDGDTGLQAQITSNKGEIALTATKTELNDAKTDYNAQIASANVKADSISQTVAEINTNINDLKQINFVLNSEFVPDFSGWTVIQGSPVYNKSTHNGSLVLELYANDKSFGDYAYSYPVDISNFNSNVLVSFDYGNVFIGDGGFLKVQIFFINDKGVVTGWQQVANINYSSNWQTFIAKDFPLKPDNGATDYNKVSLSVYVAGMNTKFLINKMMLVNKPYIGEYTPGLYNNNKKISTQQQTIDSISNIVSDPDTGLTKRVQTAEGFMASASDRLGEVENKSTNTADGLTREIQNRADGDSNTLQAGKDFTRSQIIGSETGMKSLVQQTSDGVIARTQSINLVNNSEFDDTTGRFNGWHLDNPWGETVTNQLGLHGSKIKADSGSYKYFGQSQMVHHVFESDSHSIYSDPIAMGESKPLSGSLTNANPQGASTNVGVAIYIQAYDNDRNLIATVYGSNLADIHSDWRVNSFDNKITPKGTAYVSFALLWNRGIGYFGQPMLQSSEVYTGYVPNVSATATMLSLLKDNWSVGIANNIGKITSGIVSDSVSVNLISQSVTIDSPQTQINGKACIQSADIANGAIGTVQIGEAAIDNSKIAKLDVSKLTGDTITGFNINANRQIYIASGGSLVSDVITMDKSNFKLNALSSNTPDIVTAVGNRARLTNVNYVIDSNSASIKATGKTIINGNGSSADVSLNITPGILKMSSTNWSNNSDNLYLILHEGSMTYMSGSENLYSAKKYTTVGATGIVSTDKIVAGNLALDYHTIRSYDGNKVWFSKQDGTNVDIGVRTVGQSSLVSLKENIGKIDPEFALSEVLKADIRQYNFKGDNVENRHVSPMIDDVDNVMYIPKDWLDESGKAVDSYTITGYLIQSIKALQEKINQLEQAQSSQ